MSASAPRRPRAITPSVRDYTVVSGLNLMIAVFILIINLAVDLTYGWFDPRVRYE